MRTRLTVMLFLALVGLDPLSATKGSPDYEPSAYLVSEESERVAVTPVPDDPALDAASIVERYGPPSFVIPNLIVYAGRYAGIVADVSFYLVDGELSEVAFGFPADGLSPEALRRHADRVLKRLRVAYGAPDSSSQSAGEFKTHIWRAEIGELVHRVVYRGGPRHELRAIRSRSTRKAGQPSAE